MKKIEVFLRHCYYSHLQYSSNCRPSWWDKEKVFENFKRTLNPETTHYTIIYDKHHGERENTFLKNEENVYEIDCGKESKSFNPRSRSHHTCSHSIVRRILHACHHMLPYNTQS